MIHTVKKLIAVSLAAVLLIITGVSANAADLPSGSVEGLPEKLVVRDEKGRAASETGEYYFEVLDMKPSETYKKSIAVMNLRQDASYHIYMNARPVKTTGTIRLDEECVCKLFLEGELVYEGKLTGDKLRIDGLDLGSYSPGTTRRLDVEITWIDQGSGGAIDHGARTVDSSGTVVTREQSGITHIEGETVFNWIFTAAVDKNPPEQSSRQPDTPVKTGETITFVTMGIAAAALMIMIVLVLKKRKKQNEN